MHPGNTQSLISRIEGYANVIVCAQHTSPLLCFSASQEQQGSERERLNWRRSQATMLVSSLVEAHERFPAPTMSLHLLYLCAASASATGSVERDEERSAKTRVQDSTQHTTIFASSHAHADGFFLHQRSICPWLVLSATITWKERRNQEQRG